MPRPESLGSVDGSGLRGRLREELRKYLIVSAYLYVCFGAIAFFKAAVLRDAGIEYLPFGLAAAKALILGKFVLIGEAARVGTRWSARTVLERIAHRVLLLLALLIVLIAIEELLVGRIHGRSLAQTLAEYESRLPEVLAHLLLLLLILVPLVATTEVNRALGPGVLRRLLFKTPASSADLKGGAPAHASGPGDGGPIQ